MAELVKCAVTGPCPIVGADGVDVNTGGTVMLDPEATNIPALISGGHVKLVEESAGPAAPDLSAHDDHVHGEGV